jgi:hypothetical protein
MLKNQGPFRIESTTFCRLLLVIDHKSGLLSCVGAHSDAALLPAAAWYLLIIRVQFCRATRGKIAHR